MGQYVRTSEINTSSAVSHHSNNMESGTRCCNDVTVRLFLCQLYSLLFFKYQETVEFCCCLFSICISAQLQQTDRFCSSLSKSSLENKTQTGTQS